MSLSELLTIFFMCAINRFAERTAVVSEYRHGKVGTLKICFRSFLMKKLFVGLLAFLLAAGALAGGNAVRIAGGPATGEYITFARAMCGALGQLFSCNPLETKGAQENLDRLKVALSDSAAVEVAILKGNIAATLSTEAGFLDNFTVVRSLPGEAVMLVMKSETAKAVVNWAGIKESAFLLSLGLPGEKSGDASVFNALKDIPGSALKDFEVKQYKGRPELVAAIQSGEVRMGWFVQYPNPNNALFQLIERAGLVVLGAVDPDFIQLGGSVGVQDVTIANAKLFGLGGAAKAITTTTVQAAIVARSPNQYPDGRERKLQQALITKIRNEEVVNLLPKEPWAMSWANKTSLSAKIAVEDIYNALKGESANAAVRVSELGK